MLEKPATLYHGFKKNSDFINRLFHKNAFNQTIIYTHIESDVLSFTILNINISIWLVLLVVWGLPLTYYRSKFRKIVYETNKWVINIKPVFAKETKALFGNLFPENSEYLKMRNFYRIYLLIYITLFMIYNIWG